MESNSNKKYAPIPFKGIKDERFWPDFLLHYNFYGNELKFTNKERLVNLNLFMVEEGKLIYNEVKNKATSWETMVTLITDHYTNDTIIKHHVFIKLSKARQGSQQPIHEFGDEIEALINRAFYKKNDNDKEQKERLSICFFLNGLITPITITTDNYPETMDGAIVMAICEENKVGLIKK